MENDPFKTSFSPRQCTDTEGGNSENAHTGEKPLDPDDLSSFPKSKGKVNCC